MADETLAQDLKAVFAAEADEAQLDRVLAAVASGDASGLSAEDHALLSAFEAAGPAWDAAAPRRSRRVIWLATALTLAAGLLVFVLARPEPTPVVQPRALQAMGDDFRLHVSVARGGVLRPVTPSSKLVAGDRLGLAYSAETSGHLTVIAIDSAGELSPLHPTAGVSTQVPAAQKSPLPAGAVLTDGSGCEWIVGVYAPEPIEAAAARSALTRAFMEREGCELGTVRLESHPEARTQTVRIQR